MRRFRPEGPAPADRWMPQTPAQSDRHTDCIPHISDELPPLSRTAFAQAAAAAHPKLGSPFSAVLRSSMRAAASGKAALPPRGDAHLRRVRYAEPVHGDGDRPAHPRRAPRHDRLARLRDQRGRRGRHLDPRLPLRARQRAQSGAAAPVGHRSGDENGARQIRHRAGHHHRLRRRRQQPRWPHLPIHG